MADGGKALGASREKAFDLLAELAAGRAAELARIETAARVLVAARRMVTAGGLPAALLRHPVAENASLWDPAVLTAAEFAEHLSPAALDALLAESQAWAQQALAALGHQGARRAA
jgi:hypothetical protein